MAITEFTTVRIKPTTTPERMAEFGLRSSKTFPGAISVFHGCSVDEPDLFYSISDWDITEETYEGYKQTPEFKQFIDDVMPLFASPPEVSLAQFRNGTSPLPSDFIRDAKAAGYPIIEVAHLTLNEGYSFESCITTIKGFGEIVSAETRVEPLIGRLGGEGGREIRLLIRWKEVKQHLEFKETAQYKEKVQLVRKAGKFSEHAVQNVEFKQIV